MPSYFVMIASILVMLALLVYAQRISNNLIVILPHGQPVMLQH